jgi:hypothetical protein
MLSMCHHACLYDQQQQHYIWGCSSAQAMTLEVKLLIAVCGPLGQRLEVQLLVVI